MIGRALTPEAKRAVVERILRAWLAKPDLRLGQMIEAARDRYAPLTDLFHLEDEALAEAVEHLSPPPAHDLTDSEVALARMLDAWEAWPGRIAEGRDTGPTLVMVELHEALYRHGLISPGALTEDGAALRDRARKAGVL